ncbi:MAG: hypothetical protein CVU39_21410 [Chloroflexi bacterium HGW-Chloroflexi-10]|nr:MAG: hypothetical protein CVU39_21410 [Chloroflexi bacterium HGW-Chloroflexi-10]
MQTPSINRDQILTHLRTAMEPLEPVLAMWEGGAAAFNRVDEWSDIDLQFAVEDDAVDQVIETLFNSLNQIGSIHLRYDIPMPAWHGHWQTFIHLTDTDPFLVLDIVIMRVSNPAKFLEKEIHGYQKIHFDKTGIIKENPEFNRKAHLDIIRKRLETLPVVFNLFQVFIEKEIHRNNPIEALSYYQAMTLRPLMELLRIVFSPQHYNFNTRYIYTELPQEVINRLEPLYFPVGLTDISIKRQQAQEFFDEMLKKADLKLINQSLNTFCDSMNDSQKLSNQ